MFINLKKGKSNIKFQKKILIFEVRRSKKLKRSINSVLNFKSTRVTRSNESIYKEIKRKRQIERKKKEKEKLKEKKSKEKDKSE